MKTFISDIEKDINEGLNLATSQLIKTFSNRVLVGDRVIKSAYVDLKVGDEILMGKFKNKLAVIEGFSTDEKGQPVVKTNKGDVKMYKFRIKKLIP